MQQRQTAAFVEVLASYDAALKAAPDDLAIAIKRCEFISRFADYEYGQSIDSASDELERCKDALKAETDASAAAALFVLGQQWGEEKIKFGEALLARADGWDESTRRELLSSLSSAHAFVGDAKRARLLAYEAVQLGDDQLVSSAVHYLASSRRHDDGARVLAEAPVATTLWQARERVEAALTLQDREAARSEWRRHSEAGLLVGADLKALAELWAGDIVAARSALTESDSPAEIPQQVAFQVAMAESDYLVAAQSIDLLESDSLGENLIRFATLATSAPSTLVTAPSMLAALLVVLACFAALALVPGFLLLPVHYRGLPSSTPFTLFGPSWPPLYPADSMS